MTAKGSFCARTKQHKLLGALETNFAATMEDDALRSLPLALKSMRNDAALVKKLSISGSCSTAATEDMSCDGSSTCRSKSSSGSFSTPGKKKSALKMSILTSKCNHLNVRETPDLPASIDSDDSFTVPDDATWWSSSSPIKQAKGHPSNQEETSNGVLEAEPCNPPPLDSSRRNELSTQLEKLANGESLNNNKKPSCTPSNEGASSMPTAPQTIATSKRVEASTHSFTSEESRKADFREDVFLETDLQPSESTSPTKQREKKKRTVKRTSVTKVKASDLKNLSLSRFVNEKGETDQKGVQDAIKIWKAEQRQKSEDEGSRRSSLSSTQQTATDMAGSPRKESTRSRRTSLPNTSESSDLVEESQASKHGLSNRVRSKSKARPSSGENSDGKEIRRGRSISKARPKSIGSRSKSRARSDEPTHPATDPVDPAMDPIDPAADPTSSARAEDKSNVRRSRSSVRVSEGGNEKMRSTSLARSSTQGVRKMRGRSTGRKLNKEFDGNKSSSSLARDLAKIYNDPRADLNQSASSSRICPTSETPSIGSSERRRTHSLARALKTSPKKNSDGNRSQSDATRTVASEDNAASRSRSKSVGAGLRADGATNASATPQYAPERKRVARTNSSNVMKRRGSTGRRQDEFARLANLSTQSDDGFFTGRD
jgi:hypothetical protein